MIILTDDPIRLGWILKDGRKMSEILEEAVRHYEGYKKDHDPGDRLAYLVEMYTLMERMEINHHISENEPCKMITRGIFEIMEKSSDTDKGFDNYSVRRLGCLAYLIGQIEGPERELNVPGCIEKLAEFKLGIR